VFRLPKYGLTIAGEETVTAAGPATAAGQRVGSSGRGEASADLALIEASSAALTACTVPTWTLPGRTGPQRARRRRLVSRDLCNSGNAVHAHRPRPQTLPPALSANCDYSTALGIIEVLDPLFDPVGQDT
jgi:hypothetical protein